MPDINGFLTILSKNRALEDDILLEKAVRLIEALDATLSANKVYLSPGLMMAEILHNLGLDTPTIIAAILYPANRASKLSVDAIKSEFGLIVYRLLLGIHKIDKIATDQPKGQAEKLRRLLLAVVEDIRVVLIKLAGHICDMRAAAIGDNLLKHRMAELTEEIYVPLANRLGIGQVKWELEGLAFRFKNPEAYQKIMTWLDEKRLDREDYLNQILNTISETLKKEGIEATVFGRVKHIASIWKKMHRKGVSIDEIYDVCAVRILVCNIQTCYAALGVIHALWHHISKEFDDYIANPKTNGYQSLHTAVIGPMGRTIEIQIRTPEMDEQAELGVAAHWRYKENASLDKSYEAKLAHLQQILRWQEEWATDIEMGEKFNREHVDDRVYVLTPKGTILDLQEGATVLDFAYHIHTEIGHRCRGAKVNGRIASLTQLLKSGDRVEILTAKMGGPSGDWLNRDLGFIKTARARAKILHWFKEQDRDQLIHSGREILVRELKRIGVEKLSLESLAQQLKLSNVEDLLLALGNNNIRVTHIASAAQMLLQPTLPKVIPQKNVRKALNTSAYSSDITVSGIGNLLCQMARCCKPLPPDEIIGYMTTGRGVTIHRKDCINILQAGQTKLNRLIQVAWIGKIHHQYLVDIVIKAYDRAGLLRDIMAILASEHINAITVNTIVNKKDNTADFKFCLEVSGLVLLSKVLNRIQQLPNIMEARRA